MSRLWPGAILSSPRLSRRDRSEARLRHLGIKGPMGGVFVIYTPAAPNMTALRRYKPTVCSSPFIPNQLRSFTTCGPERRDPVPRARSLDQLYTANELHK